MELVERARQLAARTLECDPIDVVHDVPRGRFHVAGVPDISFTWSDLAGVAADTGTALSVDVSFEAPGSTYPFGAHVSVVEVDPETGQVKLLRHIACDDAGRIINPLIAEGQVHGGIAQGIAQALWEGVEYDDDGNPLTTTFAEYGIPSAAELVDMQLVPMETPTPRNPLGAKGIGESGTVGATPAVQSAVIDAVRHLGVLHIDMPLTPERVWHSIAEQRTESQEHLRRRTPAG